jgi:hypothetical protein
MDKRTRPGGFDSTDKAIALIGVVVSYQIGVNSHPARVARPKSSVNGLSRLGYSCTCTRRPNEPHHLPLKKVRRETTHHEDDRASRLKKKAI